MQIPISAMLSMPMLIGLFLHECVTPFVSCLLPDSSCILPPLGLIQPLPSTHVGLVRLAHSLPGSWADPRGTTLLGFNSSLEQKLCSVSPRRVLSPIHPDKNLSLWPGKWTRPRWRGRFPREHTRISVRGGGGAHASSSGGDDILGMDSSLRRWSAPSTTAALFSLVGDVVLTNILLQSLLLMLYLGHLGFLVLFLLLFLDPEYLGVLAGWAPWLIGAAPRHRSTTAWFRKNRDELQRVDAACHTRF
jgi:hypothetical protein